MENFNPIPSNPNRNVREDNDDQYFKSIPPGCRFVPTDDELIVEYLMPKINNQNLPHNKINVVRFYEYNPEDLAAADRFESSNKNEWYFFTPRNKKYKGGRRPNRAAGNGYWKATDADKVIVHHGEQVGYRKTLVYLTGKPPNGTKTDWIMHEFRVKNSPVPIQWTENSWKLDDWVLCRLHRKAIASRNRNTNEEANNNVEEVVEGETENPTPINSTVAVEEPLAHDVAAAQNMYSYWQPLPLNELPSMTISRPGESSFIDDEILSTFLDDQVGISNGPNNDFGVPLDVVPLMSPKPQDRIPENGTSTRGYSQHSMSQTPMLNFERNQHDETHEILSVNGNSTHNIGGCSQYPMNVPASILYRHNDQPDETSRANDLSRQNMDYMQKRIPNRHHDEIPNTLRDKNGWIVGDSSQYMMNHMQMQITNRYHDEIPNTLRENTSSTHRNEGGSQHPMNQTLVSTSNPQLDNLRGIMRANGSSTHNTNWCFPSILDESCDNFLLQKKTTRGSS